MTPPEPPRPPRATYRLQFNADFRFADAARIAPYLAELGVSHVYASPYLWARPGSTHGYDIIDHGALNPELGEAADFRAMCATFREAGLGQILDFVPNHMGVWGADNADWLDALEWGEESERAGWFDVDWRPDEPQLRGRLLAPILAGPYGAELKAGGLKLRFDAAQGGLAFFAYDAHKLPLHPPTYAVVLGRDHPGLARLGDLFADVVNWAPETAARARALKGQLAALARDDGTARRALDEQIARLNGDWRALDALIARQRWRAAHFAVAGDEINYRRFFDVNDLAGLRMELPALFSHAHRLALPLIEDGALDGLRIDHVDGLFDPKTYLETLRASVSRPFYLVVEKILAAHEPPRDWPVEGTTGYEFANLTLGLLIDPGAEDAFDELYRSFSGRVEPFAEVVRAAKLRIMDHEMASELNTLAADAARLARQSPDTADFTARILRRALRQIVACFPVYRTYLDFADGAQEMDRRYVDWAGGQARRLDPGVDASVFDFLLDVLADRLDGERYEDLSRAAALRFAMRLQQYTGPVTAKGLEDTAFYRYNRFVALNEVGGEPERFGLAPAAFHKANAERAQRWPHAMLSTSTHDTKRGEDARARLAALADLPQDWAKQVRAWSRLLRARLGDVEGTAPPDRNDEYMLLQMLAGAWPLELMGAPDAERLEAFGARVAAALTKALREAKERSFWAAPDAAYEEAARGYAGAALASGESAFLDLATPFIERLARLGADNSLAQLILKMTAPGVPDIYQGCEFWDFSLMDPDNRRAVDFAARAQALRELRERLSGERAEVMRALADNWRDGRVKLAATHLLLDLRRRREDLFAFGGYRPLDLEGEQAACAAGFVRERETEAVATLVARFPGRREGREAFWRTSKASLPPGRWTDVLTGARVEGGMVALEHAFAVLPGAVYEREG